MYSALSKFVNERLKSMKVKESFDIRVCVCVCVCVCDSGEVCVVESKCAK